MEGMPASSSTAMAIGRRTMRGANSTRNTATPKAMGKDKDSASAEVTRVPMIGPLPPNTPVTGFQVVEVKKLQPKVLKAGQPPIARAMINPGQGRQQHGGGRQAQHTEQRVEGRLPRRSSRGAGSVNGCHDPPEKTGAAADERPPPLERM